MKKVYILSFLLLIGLVASQILPIIISDYSQLDHAIKLGTMFCLAYIMIHVGHEFHIDKSQMKEYDYDFIIALCSASLPWLLVALYYIFILTPSEIRTGDTWIDCFMAGRFAAPTSAGVLFTMLAAAGLASSWMYKKTRILAIFEDLDTVILMVPLQMLVIGFKIQLVVALLIMVILLTFAWKFLNSIPFSIKYPFTLLYALGVTVAAEFIYYTSKIIDDTVSVHIEILLPAFVIGTVLSKKFNEVKDRDGQIKSVLELKQEKTIAFIISSVFMVLVGLSMPLLDGIADMFSSTTLHETSNIAVSHPQDSMPWHQIALHVLAITLLCNLGKLVPALAYRHEASLRSRLAVSVSMFARGEVGAGVLIISLSYGIEGPIITISMLSLALNLLLTGLFIIAVKRILKNEIP